MSSSEMNYLKDLTKIIALRLNSLFKEMDITLWDGKFEFAFKTINDKRIFQLVDTIGLDELRLYFIVEHLSKNFSDNIIKDVNG